MAKLHSVLFAADDSWLCPDNVSAVWLTMTGGGIGSSAARNRFSFLGASAGGGSAELCVNKLVSVTPGVTYTVTVGTASAGSGYAIMPALPTPSEFAGFITLGSNLYPFVGVYTPGCRGAGGGVGGSTGADAGGFDHGGRRECGHYTGGSGGSFHDGGENLYQNHGVLGGVPAGEGSTVGGLEGGGCGGGTIWGGNNGSSGDEANLGPNITHYGAGAGGTGEPSDGTLFGGAGSPGAVILMWTA